MPFQPTDRLKALPPYLFVEIDRRKRAALAAGKDVINLGVGDPDRPTHAFIIDRMRTAIDVPANHRYPFDHGSPALGAQIVSFFQRRYGVTLDRDREVLPLIGSKEGLAHLSLAVVNPGKGVLTPDPGYPVYHSSAIFAGGVPYAMPLLESNGFLPDLSAIPSDVARTASLLHVNYPNNPTGAVATKRFFEDCVAFARQHDLVISQDAAYNEMYFDEPVPSILEVFGAKDVAIEMHSLSKTFNMTGWRLGFAVGNAEVLAALARVKANCDSGPFTAIQEAGAAAYAGIDRPEILESRAMYRERCTVMAAGLRDLGFRVRDPKATFYVWAGIPRNYDSMGVVAKLIDEAAVVCVPGSGFGKQGEGFVRFAMTVETGRVKEALNRMRSLKW